MALVKLQTGIDELRGSIGGATFSRGKFGTYVRVRKTPRNPLTLPISLAHTRIQIYSKLWATVLTPAQRTAWNTLGAATTWTNRLGDTYNPTGINLYVRASTLLEIAERVRNDTAPADADEGTRVFTMDWLEAAGIRITSIGTLTDVPAGSLLTWVSHPQPPSISSFSGPYHFLRTDDLVAVPPPYTWIPTADVLRLRRYFFRFRVIRWQTRASFAFFAQADVPVAP